MFLSIIIPAYNESSIIEDTLKKVNSFLLKKFLSASTAYKARHPCPLLKINLSRDCSVTFFGSYTRNLSYKNETW